MNLSPHVLIENRNSMIYYKATLAAQNSAMINLKPKILCTETESKASADEKQVLPQDNLVGLLLAATSQHIVI